MSINFTTTPVCGTDLDNVSASQGFALGTLVQGTNNSEWVFVKSEIVIPAYAALAISDGFVATLLNETNAPTAEVFAVAQTAFDGTVTTPNYGWVCKNGTNNIQVLALASALKDVALFATATDGYLDDAGTVGIDGIKLVADNGVTDAPVVCSMTAPHVVI